MTLESKAYINITLWKINLPNAFYQTVSKREKKVNGQTEPLIHGSPFKYHVGSNRIASPNAACNAASSRAVCNTRRTTELDSRSWFIAMSRNTAQPVIPSAANASTNGHRFCGSSVGTF